MNAELRWLHSPDINSLETFVPDQVDNFCFLLQAMVGPNEGDGEESFDIQVCTPKWLIEHCSKTDIVVGRHYLIIFEYDYRRLVDFISRFCHECTGEAWQDVARLLGRLGKWEFEDYRD